MVPVPYINHFTSRSKTPQFRFGLFSSRTIGFILLALLALLYIAQSSQGATKRITVQQLRTQADELNFESDQLRLEALRLQSLDTINQAVPQLGLEPVMEVEHLQ